MSSIIDILEKCNDIYSQGDVYELTETDIEVIKAELDLDIQSKLVDDIVYDTLYYSAKEKYPNNEFFKQLTSTNTGYGKEIRHTEPMGSMDELKSGDWDKWKIGHKEFILTDKLDGCSVVITYRNGELVQAATRGRGFIGKCIIRHLYRIKNIVLNIPYKDEIVIRGELLCPKAEIKQMLDDTEKVTGKRQKNGRNTIAGALNKKETQFCIFDHADFVAYWDSVDKGQNIEKLKSWGFTTPYLQTIPVITTENELIDIVKDRLNKSTYEIDGIILTQKDNPESGFETGTINPKASRKFKIGITNNIATSKVTNISWQVSKNGRLTPVLEIEPTEVAGCTVTHITGHNYQNIIDKKCGIGAKIKFTRAGLVIPFLQEVLEPSEEYNLTFDYYQNGVDIYVKNDLTALKESKIRQLEFFAKSLEIDQLGYANCKALYEYYEEIDEELWAEKLCTEANREQFVSVLGVNGGKAYDSLHRKLEDITEVEFAAASGAFGPSIGKRILQQVYNKYNKLVVTEDELRLVEGFGDSRVYQYMSHIEGWRDTAIYLSNVYGITFKTSLQNISEKLKEYIVCFSGIRDKELIDYINKNGGNASDIWKKDTNILVVKDINSNSSKMKKAKENNCKILTIDEAKNFFGGLNG